VWELQNINKQKAQLLLREDELHVFLLQNWLSRSFKADDFHFIC